MWVNFFLIFRFFNLKKILQQKKIAFVTHLLSVLSISICVFYIYWKRLIFHDDFQFKNWKFRIWIKINNFINFSIQIFTFPYIIHTARAFCRVQNFLPDDLQDSCVIVMRSDVNMSSDAESHEMMYGGYSSSAADINL